MGDSVIVVNAIHVHFPGPTWDTKIYKFWRSRRTDPRGPQVMTAKHLMYTNPGLVVSLMVKQMLPTKIHRNSMYRKLYVYPGAIHPHWGIPQVVVPVQPVDPAEVPNCFSVEQPFEGAVPFIPQPSGDPGPDKKEPKKLPRWAPRAQLVLRK
mmetsp:Transcript_32393/g.70882  ORF Transcript_32393/g.70882 Transcript_32393/m.70882 type:complete len:152 (+) Transcript_32393:1-456(+)